MDQAVAAARTDIEKQRVAVFKAGIWDYMVEGRAQYDSRASARQAPPPEVTVPKVAGAGGDLERVSWADALPLTGWGTLGGEATHRAVEGRVAHDGQYLYVQLSEALPAGDLIAGPNVHDGDDWELFVAAQRSGPYRQLCVGPDGRNVATARGEAAAEWDSEVLAISDTQAGDRWTVSLALPLSKLLPGGVKPGGKVFANLYRASPGAGGLLAWTPTFATGFHDVSRLAQLTLAPD